MAYTSSIFFLHNDFDGYKYSKHFKSLTSSDKKEWGFKNPIISLER